MRLVYHVSFGTTASVKEFPAII